MVKFNNVYLKSFEYDFINKIPYSDFYYDDIKINNFGAKYQYRNNFN